MTAISDLDELFRNLTITRHDHVWTFRTSREVSDHPETIMAFCEPEGWTYIIPADQHTTPENRFIWLECSVHSDLNAVGFLARIAAALAGANIPCNAVAAFHHDHIFVPESLADQAEAVLNGLRTG